MQEIAIAFSPAIAALPYSIFLQAQMIAWLNQTFICNAFKSAKQDATVYVFLDSEGKPDCNIYQYGEYLGCFYYPNRIYLNQRLFGNNSDWQFARHYRRQVLIHEFQHYFLPSHIHQGNELQLYEKENC